MQGAAGSVRPSATGMTEAAAPRACGPDLGQAGPDLAAALRAFWARALRATALVFADGVRSIYPSSPVHVQPRGLPGHGLGDVVRWVREKSLPAGTDAVAPAGVAIPTCGASWIPSLHIPSSVGGNPRISVLIRAAATCRRRLLPEGAALALGDPGCSLRGGTSSEGALAQRRFCLVVLSLPSFVSFSFLLGMFLLSPQHFPFLISCIGLLLYL